MVLEIEDAQQYFLIPLKEQESSYLIGGKASMDFLARFLEEKDFVAVTGIMHDKCYLLVNLTDEECRERLKLSSEALTTALKKG